MITDINSEGLLVHGHTHRPARHEHRADGRVCERWMLYWDLKA
jgi:UDP-2,3-diacylglucosamine hydrolase